MMIQYKKGFTLIELMIAVMIVGVLASIALPAYQDYMIRSKITEGMVFAESAKYEITTDVSTLIDLNVISTNWNDQPNYNGAVQTSKYIDSVTISTTTGVITIDYNHLTVGISGTHDQITLSPSVHSAIGTLTLVQSITQGQRGSIDWACVSSSSTTATSIGLPFVVPARPVLGKYVTASCR